MLFEISVPEYVRWIVYFGVSLFAFYFLWKDGILHALVLMPRQDIATRIFLMGGLFLLRPLQAEDEGIVPLLRFIFDAGLVYVGVRALFKWGGELTGEGGDPLTILKSIAVLALVLGAIFDFFSGGRLITALYNGVVSEIEKRL